MKYFVLLLILIGFVMPQAFGTEEIIHGYSSFELLPSEIITDKPFSFEIKFMYYNQPYSIESLSPVIEVNPSSARQNVHIAVDSINVYPGQIFRIPVTMTVDSKIEHEKIFLNLSFVGNNSNSDIVYKSGWTNSVIIDILQNDTVSDESYSVVNVNDGSLEKKDWQVYNLTTQDGQQFRIPYNIVGGKIDDMQALIEGVVIKISATYSGTLEILIPRDLFGDDTSNQESTSFVLLDGEEIQVIEKRNLCFRTITVNFPSNGSKIIVGDTSDALLTGISNNIFVPPIQLYSNSTYHSGDTAVIQGCTSLAEDHENIQINVMNNKIIQTEYITPEIDGTFSKDIKIAGEQGKTYSISATYGDYTAVPEFPIVILVLIASIIPIILMRTAKIRTG